ncbi:MAG: hypothetical protein AAFW70_04840 [Cyanobacteria bacterium J06635_10]
MSAEQKSRIDEVLWLFENRLEPFFNILHGTYFFKSRQLIAGFKLFLLSLKKYLMSFLPLALQNNLGRL